MAEYKFGRPGERHGLLNSQNPQATGGVSRLSDLSDADTGNLSPVDGHILTWNETSQVWERAVNTGGGASEISDLTDVNTGNLTPADGHILVWNQTSGVWERSVPSPGGGASELSDLTDVDTSNLSPADGHVLTWSQGAGLWERAVPAPGGGDSWRGEWNSILTYNSGDRVRDGWVLARANTTTTQRPCPQISGPPVWDLGEPPGWTNTPASALIGLIAGNRYTLPNGGWVKSLKFNVPETGNTIQIMYTRDPLGDNVSFATHPYIAYSLGEHVLTLPSLIFPPGSVVDFQLSMFLGAANISHVADAFLSNPDRQGFVDADESGKVFDDHAYVDVTFETLRDGATSPHWDLEAITF